MGIKDIPKNRFVSNIEIDNAATYNESLPLYKTCHSSLYSSSIRFRTWFRAWFVPRVIYLMGIKDISKNSIVSNIEIDSAATYNKSLPLYLTYISKPPIVSNNKIDNAATNNKSLPMYSACYSNFLM